MDIFSIVTLSSASSQLRTKKTVTSEISKEQNSNKTVGNDEIDEDDISLRFSSDDEDTLVCTDTHQTNFQPIPSDHNLDARAANSKEITTATATVREVSKQEPKKLTYSQHLSNKENLVLIKGALNFETISRANLADDSCSVDKKESTMSGSDRLMYNPTKHWNFKGWKSMNSSRGYSHRGGGGGGDWYKQHYSDKDKYSKTHYHNQSKFRLQNTPRSMFQSGPPLASDRRAKRDSVKLAHKLKSTLTSSESSSSGSSSDKKQLVKENGHPNGFSRSETSVQKNKSIEDAKKSLNSIKIVNVTSEHKENISTAKSSSDKKGKEGTSEILKSKRVKIIRERPATVTKECEVVDLDDDNMDSQESRISYNSIIEKIIDDDDDTDCIITEEMVPRKETPVCEPISEMQIKIVNIGTSHEDALEQDNCETVMEVDDSSSQSECDVIEQNDESGPIVVEQASISNNAENSQEMKNSTDNSNEVPVTEDTNEEDKEDKEEEKGDEEENEDEEDLEDVEDEEDEEEKGEEKEKENVEEEEEKQKVEEEKEIEKGTEKANGIEIESEKLVAEEKESEQEKEAEGSEKEKEIEEKETEQEKEAEKEVEQEQEKEKEIEQEERELTQDKELEQEKELLEKKDEETDKVNENEKEEDSANKDTSEEKSEEAKEDSTNNKVQDSEMEVSENQAEEKENTDNTAAPAAEEANEAVDAQSDAGSPQPLMIDETDGTELNDAKPEDKDNEAVPPKSPSSSDNVDKQTEATSQKESESKNEDSTEKPEKEDEKQTSEVAEKDGNVLEDVDMTEDTQMEAPVFAKNGSDADKVKDDIADSTSNSSNETSSTVPIGELEENKASEENGIPVVVLKKRRRKRRNVEVPPFNGDENETRQKRRSALNAEEIIRKELKYSEDADESSDESYKLANNKKQQSQSSNKEVAAAGSNSQPRPVSPPSSLKRTFDDLSSADVDAGDDESHVIDRTSGSGGATKKLRSEEVVAAAGENKETAAKNKETPAEMKDLVRQITQEDIRKKVKNLSAEDLEAMLLQKIVECITIRGEMGKLREQARSSKRTLEATRTKCQQLQKQVEGFEMVLKRLTFDKNINPEKYVAPIKINRSVGLQVNFQSEHGMQNLKQIQAIRSAAATRAAATSTIVSQIQDSTNRLTSPKKVLKTRSPRRPDVPTSTVGSGMSAVVSSVPTVSSTTALVSNKLLETSNKRPITLQNAGNIVQILQPNQQPQTVVVNRQVLRTASSTTTVSSASDLIDLTDEEDKSKSPAAQTTTTLANRVPTRVYQAVSASGVSLAGATNLRLVTTNSQTSPNTIVNNINGQKVTYGTVVMNGNKQLLLTSNQLRQVSSVQGKNITALYNKQGISTLTNGQTLRVLQPATTVQAQILRHPAALPETPSPVVSSPSWKLPPPAPSLKISKVATGIVLSWNMVLTDKFATIVSYQLFAYQEVAGTAPSPSLWKKVGDVRALPLPMACTLTQFTEGNNYHFAVRAVDEHTRYGQYSKPGNISL